MPRPSYIVYNEDRTEASSSPSVAIVTDSASDITQEEASELGIRIVPLTTTFPDGTYRDGIDLSAEAFYEKLAATDAIPFTSQPSPAEFIDAFESALQCADEVVCVALSSGLSGTYQSACIAQGNLSRADQAKVHIVDTQMCSVAEGLLVRVAVQMRDSRANAQEIAFELEQRRSKVHIVALVDTLEYIQKGGRMPKALATAATLLSIKPVIGMVDGKVGLLGQARGLKKGRSVLTKAIEQNQGINLSLPFRLAYSGGGRDLLEAYWRENGDLFAAWSEEPPTSMLGPVIGTHAGPGAIAVAFFEKE